MFIYWRRWDRISTLKKIYLDTERIVYRLYVGEGMVSDDISNLHNFINGTKKIIQQELNHNCKRFDEFVDRYNQIEEKMDGFCIQKFTDFIDNIKNVEKNRENAELNQLDYFINEFQDIERNGVKSLHSTYLQGVTYEKIAVMCVNGCKKALTCQFVRL